MTDPPPEPGCADPSWPERGLAPGAKPDAADCHPAAEQRRPADRSGCDDPLPPIARLIAVMAQLRGPDGCPWDRAQTFATIAPYTIEEAHEVADAIARGDLAALRDELGDLLLQVVFHARMAEEQNAFSLREVAEAIVAKLERRHPHVFGGAPAADAAQVSAAWEAIKAAETGRRSALDGIGPGLPALLRARKLGDRAARAGFDWSDAAGARAKVLEELEELGSAATDGRRREEAGDLLFALVQWLRHLGIDAEAALVAANAKFERRFRTIEETPGFKGLSLAEKEALWQAAKRPPAADGSPSSGGPAGDAGGSRRPGT